MLRFMFLLPLYYQVVRGQSALMAGLLMAPQGIGAALVMRKAGDITDRVGARRVVPLGVVLIIAGSLPYVFVTASTQELSWPSPSWSAASVSVSP